MNSLIIDVVKELLVAWRKGTKRIRYAISIAVILIIFSIILLLIRDFLPWLSPLINGVAGIFGFVAGAITLTIFAYQKSAEVEKQERRIEEVEKRAQDNPQETQAAWELARVKLESYINKNLTQIGAIFWLTVFIMIVGFSFIGFGVFEVYEFPEKLSASILSAVSGIVLNFIGATFLVLYRSTMSQATEYVNILERINAVGMSVQILETLDDNNSNLKQEVTAEIAKQLLVMYADIRKKT